MPFFSLRLRSRSISRRLCCGCRNTFFRLRSAVSPIRAAQVISARRSSFGVRFDQLDAVAERIVDMTAVAPLDGLIGGAFVPGLPGSLDHCRGVIVGEGRMRLWARTDLL